MSKSSNKTINKKDNTKLVDTLIIVGIVFLIASLVIMFTGGKDKSSIKEINYQEYLDVIKENKYNIILLTSPTCSHCINYKPYVNYVASENNLEVYDIDLSKLEYEEYISIHDKYSSIKNEYDQNNNPVIPTPVTIIVRNGEEVTSTLGDIGQKGFTSLLKNNNIIK